MKRVRQLVPLSRFHKRVLFIGESCKSVGARFSGYPKDIRGRAELLLDFRESLEKHLSVTEDGMSIIADCDGLENAILDEFSGRLNQLREALSLFDAQTVTEENLNELGLLLVEFVRYTERVVFQQMQQRTDEGCLEKVFEKTKQAGIYELHSL